MTSLSNKSSNNRKKWIVGAILVILMIIFVFSLYMAIKTYIDFNTITSLQMQ